METSRKEGADAPLVAGQVLSSLFRKLSGVSLLEHQAEIFQALYEAVRVGDVAMLVLLGWFTLPLARVIYNISNKGKKDNDDMRSKRSSSSIDEDADPEADRP